MRLKRLDIERARMQTKYMHDEKTCGRCKTAKPRSEFQKDRSRRDGLRNQCKACARDISQRWLEKNPGYMRSWRENNPDYMKKWIRDRPLYMRLYSGKLRAEAFGSPVDEITESDILEYWEANGIAADRCYYTGQPLGDDWHIDHKVPISRGGPHSLSNLVPCSASANEKKGIRTPEEFLGV